MFSNTKNKITKYENLEIAEVVLVHCNIINNDYKHGSRVLYTFVSNKSSGHLLDISLENVMFLKAFNSEFPYIEVWFTDQKF